MYRCYFRRHCGTQSLLPPKRYNRRAWNVDKTRWFKEKPVDHAVTQRNNDDWSFKKTDKANWLKVSHERVISWRTPIQALKRDIRPVCQLGTTWLMRRATNSYTGTRIKSHLVSVVRQSFGMVSVRSTHAQVVEVNNLAVLLHRTLKLKESKLNSFQTHFRHIPECCFLVCSNLEVMRQSSNWKTRKVLLTKMIG